VFGLVPKGASRPESDVDFLVEFEPDAKPTLLTMAEIEVELSPLLRGRKVDLRTPRDLSRYFRYEARWYHPHTPGVLLKQNSNNEDCAVIKTAVINLQP
jgi:hypothetical protein